MNNQEMGMDQNVSQEKSWQQIYWEEQNRKKEAEEKNKKQAVGLTVLIIGVVLVLAGVTWSAIRGGGLFGMEVKDVRRVEHSGQRAYTYMVYLSEEFGCDRENSNLQYRYVADQYGYVALVCIDMTNEMDYLYYESGIEPEEMRLDGYAVAYDDEAKEMIRYHLVDSYGYTKEEVDDELLEKIFGKYYLKVDAKSTQQVMWAWLLVAGGIVLTVVGGIIYFGRFRRS